MPEQPEVVGTKHVIQQGKGSPYSQSRKPPPLFSLVIHPSVFATGSEERPYSSLTVDRTQFAVKPPRPSTYASTYDVLRAENEDYLYLLDQTPQGVLHCETRGKLMVLAAGNHAVTISFGLEAHITGMPRMTYDKIISNSIPGTNTDVQKSALIRSFIFPEELIVPNSSTRRPRRINIFAAFVSDEWVWVLSDFVRLIRMHVISRDRPWEASDFLPTSPYWLKFFEPLNGGPDWVTEQDLAEEALDRWRETVLNRDRAYRQRLLKWKKQLVLDVVKARKAEPPATYTLQSYWGGSVEKLPTQEIKKIVRVEPVRPMGSIIKAMASKKSDAFAGYGRHCINDFLYQLAIFPGTPSYIICRSEERYQEFKTHLHEYMTRYSTDEFLNDAASIPNTGNPFTFNERSHRTYTSRYIDVFRRASKRVPREIYNQHVRQGLLDKTHTIGLPYTKNLKAQLCKPNRETKTANVYFIPGRVKAYTLIRAKRPQGWDDGEETPVKQDITKCGHRTTIGLAQYHEHLLNRPDLSQVKLSAGRPIKRRKGKIAQPKITRKNLKDLERRVRRPKLDTEGANATEGDRVEDAVLGDDDSDKRDNGDNPDGHDDSNDPDDPGDFDDFDDPAPHSSEDEDPSEYSVNDDDDYDDDEEEFNQLPSQYDEEQSEYENEGYDEEFTGLSRHEGQSEYEEELTDNRVDSPLDFQGIDLDNLGLNTDTEHLEGSAEPMESTEDIQRDDFGDNSRLSHPVPGSSNAGRTLIRPPSSPPQDLDRPWKKPRPTPKPNPQPVKPQPVPSPYDMMWRKRK